MDSFLGAGHWDMSITSFRLEQTMLLNGRKENLELEIVFVVASTSKIRERPRPEMFGL